MRGHWTIALVCCTIAVAILCFANTVDATAPPGGPDRTGHPRTTPSGRGRLLPPDDQQPESVQKMDRKLSFAVSFLSLLILLVPLTCSCCGYIKIRRMNAAVASHRKFSEHRARLQDSPTRRAAIPLSRASNSEDDIEMQSLRASDGNALAGAGGSEVPGSDANWVQCALAFAHISFSVQVKQNGFCKDTTKKKLLSDVSGIFQPGTLTAVMGPSGCGKTTLLTLLSGRAEQGEFEGLRMINGKYLSLSEFNNALRFQGFVAQTDVFLPDLTVYDTMLYAALLRLPQSLPLSEKLQRVDDVLAEVGLSSVADCIVGGPSRKGISGGQRRRLSIGVELLRLPSLLLLDEPTSGLDATASLKLVNTLAELARAGRTVVTTIHQPRPEIWNVFDQVLLMGVGGKTMFVGKPSDAIEHFSRAQTGLSKDTYDNPADFAIDCVGLDPERDVTFLPDSTDLAQVWSSSDMKQQLEARVAAVVRSGEGASRGSHGTGLQSAVTATFTHQLFVLFARRVRRISSDKKGTAMFYGQVVITALVIGGAFSYTSTTPWLSDPYKVVMFLLTTASYAMVLQYLVLVPEYYDEAPMFLKERSCGSCSNAAYVFTSFLADTPRAVLQSLMLVVMGYYTTELNPAASYVSFALMCLCMGVCAWQAAIGVVSVGFTDIGMAYSVIFLVLGLGTLFGGVVITFPDIPPVFRWAYYTSIPAITYRALMINDLACCHLTVSCEDLTSVISPGAGGGGMGGTTPAGGFTPPPGSGPGGSPFGNADQLRAGLCLAAEQRAGTMPTSANIGYGALKLMSLDDDSKYRSLMSLIILGVLCRLLAWAVLWKKQRSMNRLEEDTKANAAIRARLTNAQRS